MPLRLDLLVFCNQSAMALEARFPRLWRERMNSGPFCRAAILLVWGLVTFETGTEYLGATWCEQSGSKKGHGQGLEVDPQGSDQLLCLSSPCPLIGAGGVAPILWAMFEVLATGLGVANSWQSAQRPCHRTASSFWGLEMFEAILSMQVPCGVIRVVPRFYPLLYLPPSIKVEWNLPWKIT
ncbi:hypothetical protein Cgig2_030495 [Carnegiea gigantea]|uniref:Uncharacterized protein n=1 Tax=Carnegiea gigantea TaxID=171969 RepID=A0A9Q1GR14_9CARY|nr:hypothetical protein Cgig2_030495 [Carnegiea gigantea]